MVPIDGKNVDALDSGCSENTTTLTLDAYKDKSMNLTMTFNKVNASAAYYSNTPMSYVLNMVELEYDTTNPYFHNHKGIFLFSLVYRDICAACILL